MLASVWLLVGCWLPAPCRHASVTLLPVPACCVPGLLSLLKSPLPAPCHPFPTLQPRGLPGWCCQSRHCILVSLARVSVCSCLSGCWLWAALWAGERSGWELPTPLGLPLWQGVLGIWGLWARAFRFGPWPLAKCLGSSAGSGFPPLPLSGCIPKLGDSTPGSGIHYLQLPSLGWVPPLPCIPGVGIPGLLIAPVN